MKMEQKMVDFAIYIQPDPKKKKAIRDVLIGKTGSVREPDDVWATTYAFYRNQR